MTQNKGRFSYSKLNTYESCPYKYNLVYNEKLFSKTSSLAAQYGSLIHKILERVANSYKDGQPINYEELKSDFYNYNLPKRGVNKQEEELFGVEILRRKYSSEWYSTDTKSGMNFEAKSKKFVEENIYDFENYMKEHPELEVIGCEIQFEYEYRGYVFYGFIDRLLKYKDENKYIVVDIKTKDHPFDDKDLPTPLQFYIYVQAIKDKFGGDVECECFYELPIIGLKQRAGTRGFEARGKKKLDKLIDLIESNDYHPSPSPLCFYCQFSNTCPEQPPEFLNKCPYYSLWRKGSPSFEKKFEWEGPEKHEIVMKKFLEREQQEGQKPYRKFTIDF